VIPCLDGDVLKKLQVILIGDKMPIKLTIIGLIIAMIMGAIGLWAVYAILEAFRAAATFIVSLVAFFWAWDLLKEFKIQPLLAVVSSGISAALIGMAIYKSWTAIIILGIIIGVVYVAWYFIKPRIARIKELIAVLKPPKVKKPK